jgi:lycopene beta-cyclase
MTNAVTNVMTEVADVADVAILGGGLAGCLTALALARHRPEARVVLIEEAPELGGNHTWCCFASDLDGQIPAPSGDGRARTRTAGTGDGFGQLGDAGALLAGLVTHRWSAHRVRFPGFERRLQIPYLCLTAARLREVMASSFVAPPVRRVLVSARVIAVAPHAGSAAIALSDGRRLDARLVLDARGGRFGAASGDGEDAPATGSGYQKFLGREVTLVERTADTDPTPLVMDATVPQEGDGFRFMYVLPLGDTGRVLLEDTSFSDGPELDLDGRRRAIDAYLRARGLRIEHVHREESGILPMPSTNPTPSPAAPPRSAAARSGLAIGYAGGLFHAGTGYSLPIAAAAAVALATAVPGADPEAALRPIRERMHAQNRYFALLNRLMFAGVAPGLRWRIFARFYGLPAPTIARFYAARTTLGDRARMLVGRPPPGFRWRSLLPATARHSNPKIETASAARSDLRDLVPAPLAPAPLHRHDTSPLGAGQETIS